MLWRPKIAPEVHVDPTPFSLGPGFGLSGKAVSFPDLVAVAVTSQLEDWVFLDRWRQLFEAEWPHPWCIGIAGPFEAQHIRDLVAPSRQANVVVWPEATIKSPFAGVLSHGHFQVQVFGQADEEAWERFLSFA